METLWHDFKYATRGLMKSPAFTLVITLTLGLGIGANTGIFSVVNTLLLRPLPVRDADRLVVVAVSHEGNTDPHRLSYLDYQDYQKSATVFEGMSGYNFGLVGLSEGGRAERMAVGYVTPGYFQMLGINAAHGRVLLPEEGEKQGADPVLVLGHTFWKKRFGADPSVVGRAVSINGRGFTIVGVVPEYFRGTYALVEFEGYIPIGMSALVEGPNDQTFTHRDNHQLHTLARLKPGVSIAQARAEMEVICRQLEKQYPDSNKTTQAHVLPENLARPEPNAQNPIVATIFMLLTGLVLLVACVNVANLLLVRATLRQKEIAIRAALGAGQGRLVRQLLTESMLLSALGGVAGIVIGRWVSNMLASVRLPGDLPFRFDFSFDWRVFGFVAAVVFVAGAIVGLLPALRATRADLNDALREGGRGSTAGGARHRLRNLLVVGQVAGSMVLLIAAGLFIRSLANAQSVDLGFDPRGVLNLHMDVAQQGYDESRGRAFYKELERRVRSLPGVESVAIAYSIPMGYYNTAEYVNAEGQEVTAEKRRPLAGYNTISPEYLKTMRIPLLRGRNFTEQDTQNSTPVAIVNEFMAKHLWPGQEAIGRRFSMTGAQGPYIEVVGVTKLGKYTWIFDDPGMYFFLPMEQKYFSLHALQVRTTGRPEDLGVAIQKEIRALDASLPVFDVVTMQEALNGGNGFFLIRMGAMMAGALGSLGLLLAVVGVYGVVSYAASQRTHEIGIRMALGAQRSNILRMIFRHGLTLVLIGMTCGLAMAFVLARFIGNFLFGISSYDPVAFAGVSILLAAVAMLACLIPAQRATRVDPMIALRYE